MAWTVGAAGLECQSQQQLQQQSLAARANGCQRPWAGLQLVPWALLPALALGFFALIIPLCRTNSTRVALEAAYGILLVTTMALALATTIIDPADPRVKAERQRAKAKGVTTAAAAAATAAAKTNTDVGGEDKMEADDELEESAHHRGAFDSTDTSATGVYCYLCKTDVAETSAHCGHCRKCCDRFDHHCAWLSTCIGRPNYAFFLSMVAAALALLGVQTTAAAVLLARYVLQREAFVDHGELTYGEVESLLIINSDNSSLTHLSSDRRSPLPPAGRLPRPPDPVAHGNRAAPPSRRTAPPLPRDAPVAGAHHL